MLRFKVANFQAVSMFKLVMAPLRLKEMFPHLSAVSKNDIFENRFFLAASDSIIFFLIRCEKNLKKIIHSNFFNFVCSNFFVSLSNIT